jgi:hypothetical protein
MNYSLDFGGSPQDLTMTLAGAVDAPSIRTFIEEMMAHPEYRAGMRILVDLSELDTSTITQEQYEGLGDAISGRDHRFPSKAIAIVAPGGRTYDDAVRHRAYVGGSRSGREVFHSRVDATAWLAQQR